MILLQDLLKIQANQKFINKFQYLPVALMKFSKFSTPYTPPKQSHQDNHQNKQASTYKKQPKYSHHQSTSKKTHQNKHHKTQSNQHRNLNIQNLLKESMYSKASQEIKQIQYLKDEYKKNRIRTMSAEHSREKIYVKELHQKQMKSFRRAYGEIFKRFRFYQFSKKKQLDEANQRDKQIFRYEIIKRCRSTKPIDKLAKLKQLQTYEKCLRKRGKTGELRKIREQKQFMRIQCQKQQQSLYKTAIEQQQTKYKQRQSKRYHFFQSKIKESKKDYERVYNRQEQRLKQKFKNLMGNLEHEQKLQMNMLLNNNFA